MEVASLALGAVSLAALFNGCLTLADYVSVAQRLPEDCRRLALVFTWENVRLSTIRDRFQRNGVNLDDPFVVNRNLAGATPVGDGVTIEPSLVACTLIEIEGVLKQSQSIIQKYEKPAKPDGLKKLFSSRLRSNRLAWVAGDKSRLKELLEELKLLNANLEQLDPRTSTFRRELDFEAHVVLSASLDQLREFAAIASGSAYHGLHQGAHIRMAKMAMEMSQPQLWQPSQTRQDFQIHSRSITQRSPIGTCLGVYSSAVHQTGQLGREVRRRDIILEQRPPLKTSNFAMLSPQRLNALVDSLRSMRVSPEDPSTTPEPVDFGVPFCLGWTAPDGADSDVIELVYENPKPAAGSPTSLYTLLRRNAEPSDRPTIASRLNLALRLAKFYARFIAVGYLHKGLHSHNVLFFDEIAHPYIIGCADSRPDSAPQFSTPISGEIAERELYIPWYMLSQIREADHSRRTRWSAAADIYGVGVMLIEIGRWSPAENALGTASVYHFHDRILPGLVEELSGTMGLLYSGVARTCLNAAEFSSSTEIGVWDSYSDRVLKQLELCQQ